MIFNMWNVPYLPPTSRFDKLHNRLWLGFAPLCHFSLKRRFVSPFRTYLNHHGNTYFLACKFGKCPNSNTVTPQMIYIKFHCRLASQQSLTECLFDQTGRMGSCDIASIHHAISAGRWKHCSEILVHPWRDGIAPPQQIYQLTHPQSPVWPHLKAACSIRLGSGSVVLHHYGLSLW